jgi:hypothetical protein
MVPTHKKVYLPNVFFIEEYSTLGQLMSDFNDIIAKHPAKDLLLDMSDKELSLYYKEAYTIKELEEQTMVYANTRRKILLEELERLNILC